MHILFFSMLRIELDRRGIYVDMINELAANGHRLSVISPVERRTGRPTELLSQGNIKILHLKTLNSVGDVSIIEKGVATLSVDSLYRSAIKKYFADVRFDLVLYATPPVTFTGAINYVKKRDDAMTYLLLKDIFPQNAVDLGMMIQRSMLYKYFRKKEKNLYRVSDYIGCMSQGNCQYLLEHNKEIDPARVEICANSIKPAVVANKSAALSVKQKYQIAPEATLFVYGGNLGKPQGMDFLFKVIEALRDYEDIFIFIVGQGTEYARTETFFKENNFKNAKLLPFMQKDDYDRLLEQCDVGLIFLDNRFTIPNIPSRLTAYLDLHKPVLAATDPNTDLREIIQEANCGLCVLSGDLDAYLHAAKTMAADKEFREQCGRDGHEYLLKHYDVADSCKVITGHFAQRN